MSEDFSHSSVTDGRLQALRGNTGIFAEKQQKKIATQKKKDTLEKLTIAIKSALFLDDKRKKAWLSAISILSTEEAEVLMGAIIRENFRWKKGERRIEFSTNL